MRHYSSKREVWEVRRMNNTQRGWRANNPAGFIVGNTTECFIYKGFVERYENKPAVHLLGKRDKRESYYLMNLDVEPEIGDEVRINYNDQLPYRKGQLLLGGAVCHE